MNLLLFTALLLEVYFCVCTVYSDINWNHLYCNNPTVITVRRETGSVLFLPVLQTGLLSYFQLYSEL